jgi:Rrf2 family nitric oxide-sensitive transcriptional repressor
MLSQTTEYALRAVVVLAQDPRVPQTGQRIAEASQVPQDYLMKVLQPLSKAGLLAAQRGRNGGFLLTRSPELITVLDVVSAVEPLRRIRSCPLRLKAHSTNLCPLHRKLDDAIQLVEDAFRSTTLADILAEPSPMKPLCLSSGALSEQPPYQQIAKPQYEVEA